MDYADFEDGKWLMDPGGRFRLRLPTGWRLAHSKDMATFWVYPPQTGPGDLRLAMVGCEDAETVRGSEIARAAGETRPGVKITEKEGSVRAHYSRRVETPLGQDLHYLWEVGAGAWVAVWSYVIDSRLRTAPGVALEFGAVRDIVGSFRFAARIEES
ncbi:MAG: hypothetical protein GF320_15830 [Armatimonadia bacterium]|nr:hypothetical protein [Armatimonadia bacterium]